jgi:hypothetical protein
MKHRGVNSALAFFLTAAQSSGGDLRGSGMSELTVSPTCRCKRHLYGANATHHHDWAGGGTGTPSSLKRHCAQKGIYLPLDRLDSPEPIGLGSGMGS